MRNSDDHVLFNDHVFHVNVSFLSNNFSFSIVPVFSLYFGQFFNDNSLHEFFFVQYFFEPLYELCQLVVFCINLFPLKGC